MIVVLPTGSGKSAIIYSLIPHCGKGITIIFCPLRSLLHDWERRLKQDAIIHHVLQPTDTHINAHFPVILASLDRSLLSTNFAQAIATVSPGYSVVRFVIDEAHLILTEANYRAIMARVQELRQGAEVQMICMTATLPPTAINALRSAANLAEGENTVVIRASSNRPELLFCPIVRLVWDEEVTMFNICSHYPCLTHLTGSSQVLFPYCTRCSHTGRQGTSTGVCAALRPWPHYCQSPPMFLLPWLHRQDHHRSRPPTVCFTVASRRTQGHGCNRCIWARQ